MVAQGTGPSESRKGLRAQATSRRVTNIDGIIVWTLALLACHLLVHHHNWSEKIDVKHVASQCTWISCGVGTPTQHLYYVSDSIESFVKLSFV